MTEERTDFLPMVDSWAEWGDIFTDAALWEPVVRRICQQHQDEIGVAGEAIVGGYPGSTAVFIVDDAVVVKIYPPFLEQDFHLERETYDLIDTRLDPYLPDLMVADTYPDRIDWPYLVLSFLPGQPIREVREKVPPDNMEHIARELGYYIRRLHTTPLTNAKIHKTAAADWFAFLAERILGCLQELRDKTPLTQDVIREVARFLRSDALKPPDDFRPLLLNGDFTEDHMLLEKRLGEWRISGLIDWADALVGAREYDWVALWFGLCSQDVPMFRTVLNAYDPGIQLNLDFRRRMMAFTFIHRFGPEMLGELLRQPGAPSISTLAELQSWLWPPM